MRTQSQSRENESQTAALNLFKNTSSAETSATASDLRKSKRIASEGSGEKALPVREKELVKPSSKRKRDIVNEEGLKLPMLLS